MATWARMCGMGPRTRGTSRFSPGLGGVPNPPDLKERIGDEIIGGVVTDLRRDPLAAAEGGEGRMGVNASMKREDK